MDAESRTAEQARPRYVVRWASQASEEAKPVNWVVKGILAIGRVAVLFGGSGTKKTYTALHMGLCVASGTEWLGHPVTQGPVLVIDEESGQERMDLRLTQIMRGLPAPTNTPLAYVSLAGFHLSNEKDLTQVETLIDDLHPNLVIIDALAEVAPGDENSAKDMQPVMQALKHLAETRQCGILVIHHSTKTGKTYRGSSVIKANADLMLNTESKEDKPLINLSTEKNRDGPAFQLSAFAYWSAEPEEEQTFTLSPTAVKPEAAKLNHTQLYVLDFVTQQGCSNMHDIQKHAKGCTPKAAEMAVYQLVKLNRLKNTVPSGKAGVWEVVPQSNGHHPGGL